jgi:uncharacterized protein YndB with AHSA1/START domain
MTEATGQTLSVIVERHIPHAPEKIWRALTQPQLIEEWLMATDFSPEVGRPFTLRGAWGGLECEVLAVEPHTRLSYTWNHVHPDPAFALQSVVTFTLTPAGSGTHLRMEQVGFRPGQKQAYHGARAGWATHLENLEKAVSRLDPDSRDISEDR